MGNPLHFIQASDTSAFAALHTEQGALPSQYEALQAYLKKIGLGRVRHPVGRTRYRAGHTGGLRLHFLVYAAGRRRHPPLPPRRGRKPEQARAALRRAREAVTPHLDDTPGGVLLRKALFIPSADNVFVVNGHPVLVNWGLLPQGTDEATAPILWGEPENGETPSGVTGAGNGCNGSFRRSGCRGRRHAMPFPCGPCGWPFRRNKNSGRDRNGGRNRRRYCRGNGGKRHHPA